MAISKKGTRKIIIDNTAYRYKVSRWRIVSDWREGSQKLDEQFMRIARYYELSVVTDVIFNITIQLYENPISTVFIKYHSIVVDGFMGYEQVTTIKPNQIEQIIRSLLKNNWQAEKDKDIRFQMIEDRIEKSKPLLLGFPDVKLPIDNYENVVPLFKIEIR